MIISIYFFLILVKNKSL